MLKSGLITKVNSIVDYYDKNYTIVNAGTSIDEKGNTSGNISLGTIENYNDLKESDVIEGYVMVEVKRD